MAASGSQLTAEEQAQEGRKGTPSLRAWSWPSIAWTVLREHTQEVGPFPPPPALHAAGQMQQCGQANFVLKQK